jgi:hypothetical protein
MVKRMYKKGLVVGIIVLFIGVGVQPALAVEPKVSENTMETEEDCGCKEVSDVNLNRLDKALNRLEGNTGFISFLSKRNPKIAEEYQELSNRINALTEMNEEYFSIWPFPVICSILYFLLFLSMAYFFLTGDISPAFTIGIIGGVFNCDW